MLNSKDMKPSTCHLLMVTTVLMMLEQAVLLVELVQASAGSWDQQILHPKLHLLLMQSPQVAIPTLPISG